MAGDNLDKDVSSKHDRPPATLNASFFRHGTDRTHHQKVKTRTYTCLQRPCLPRLFKPTFRADTDHGTKLPSGTSDSYATRSSPWSDKVGTARFLTFNFGLSPNRGSAQMRSHGRIVTRARCMTSDRSSDVANRVVSIHSLCLGFQKVELDLTR